MIFSIPLFYGLGAEGNALLLSDFWPLVQDGQMFTKRRPVSWHAYFTPMTFPQRKLDDGHN